MLKESPTEINTTIGKNLKQKLRNFLVYGIGEKILRGFGKLISRYSLVGDTAFFEVEQFSWATQLEENWHIIRQELDYILQQTNNLPNFQDISPDQGMNISKDNLWKTYFLYGYGIKFDDTCQRCPETTAIIEKIPGLKTAFFSILLPGKHIPEHRGPYKGVIRYHLGVKIPQPQEKCRIRVDNETRHWEEGKSLIFDDSRPHEAWNETNDIRVVLFLDIVRPLKFPLSIINNILIKLIALSPFVQDANTNQKKWGKRLDKVFTTQK